MSSKHECISRIYMQKKNGAGQLKRLQDFLQDFGNQPSRIFYKIFAKLLVERIEG